VTNDLPYELFIAVRYLLARRKQAFISLISLISTLGVMVGVMALLIALALMTGLQGELRDRIVGSTAHVYVHKPGGGGITDYQAEVAKLRQLPHVTGAAPVVLGPGMITGGSGEGFLTIKDRSKDMIISGGANIYPREIEEVLLRHPAVAECSVVGRPHPEWGEEVVAFVVERTPVAPAELENLCLENIARFKRPREYRFVDALPKNNYGKVLKTELRERLRDG